MTYVVKSSAKILRRKIAGKLKKHFYNSKSKNNMNIIIREK